MKINEDFEITHDKRGWTLVEYRDGTSKDDPPKPTRKAHKTYYPTLEAVLTTMVDRAAGLACEQEKYIGKKITETKRDIIDFLGFKFLPVGWHVSVDKGCENLTIRSEKRDSDHTPEGP